MNAMSRRNQIIIINAQKGAVVSFVNGEPPKKPLWKTLLEAITAWLSGGR